MPLPTKPADPKPPVATGEQVSDPAAFLASIVESSDDAIFAATLDGIIMSWNKAAEEMFGYSAEQHDRKAGFSSRSTEPHP